MFKFNKFNYEITIVTGNISLKKNDFIIYLYNMQYNFKFVMIFKL
jgi:hypothetical protein